MKYAKDPKSGELEFVVQATEFHPCDKCGKPFFQVAIRVESLDMKKGVELATFVSAPGVTKGLYLCPPCSDQPVFSIN